MHPQWENPEVLGIGRLPARASFHVHSSAKAAREDKPDREQSLCGIWRFMRCSSPGQVPDNWAESGFQDKNWSEMEVPSLWTMGDFEDQPIYTNVRMPFRHEPPKVPELNPTGLYRLTVEHRQQADEIGRAHV